MYIKHWKLQCSPFTTAFEEELVLFHDDFAEACYSLSLASKIAPNTFWLVGTAGGGKTTLLRCAKESVRGEVRFVIIPGSFLDSGDKLLEILRPAGPSPPDSVEEILSEHFLRESHPGRPLAVAIDDADTISEETAIGECLKLYGLGRRHGWPLTVVFSGRKIPLFFETSLSHPAQTLTLPTPDTEQARAIIEHRLRLCGAKDGIFSDAALESVAELAEGNITKLLSICYLCLQKGFVERWHVIDADIVREEVEPFIRRFFERAANRDEMAELRGVAETAKAWGSNDVYHTLSSRQRWKPQKRQQPGDRGHLKVLRPPRARAEDAAAEDAAESGPGPAAAETRDEPRPVVSDGTAARPGGDAGTETIAESGTSPAAAATRDEPRPVVSDGTAARPGGDAGTATATTPGMDWDGRRRYPPLRQIYQVDERRARPVADETAPPPSATSSPTLEETDTTFRNLPAVGLYDAGFKLIRDVLARLRKSEFVDLTPLRHLVRALMASTAVNTVLIGSTISSSGEYGLDTHLLNVAILAVATGRKLNLGDEDLATLGETALLHDIGHLQIGEELLYSENRFDREDFATIKRHPRAGYELIRRQMNGSELVADIILQEHERDDGLGYPNYLSGDQIHLYAKIIGVCDVFEALTHTRAHRRELTPAEALVEINATMRRRTAPQIIAALMVAVRPALAPH